MFNLGFGEIVVVLIVALVFLGPKMLPELATGLGKIIREIRKATADIKQDIELDDIIRGPLQELRDAATLPPEELKRRDEIRAAQRKAAEAKEKEAQQKAAAAKAADEVARKPAEANPSEPAKASAAVAQPAAEATNAVTNEAVSAHGTMIASPPPSQDFPTLTPIPDLQTIAPTANTPPPRLPPPPPLPRPTMPFGRAPSSDATVIDLHAQANASAVANETMATARPLASAGRAPAARPASGVPLRPQTASPSKPTHVEAKPQAKAAAKPDDGAKKD